MFKYFLYGTPTINKITYDFKLQHSFAKRREEANNIIHKYQDKIPVILEKLESSQLRTLNKQKYLINIDLTIGQFIVMIRRQLELTPDKIIYLSINNNYTPKIDEIFKNLYYQYKDADNFLYITYL